MSIEHTFEALLDEYPHDWEMRLVYADWLDEIGETVKANGQRWQAMERKTPKRSNGVTAWYWLDSKWEHFAIPAAALIPNHLCGSPKHRTKVYSIFETRQDAEAELAAELAAELRRQGIVAGGAEGAKQGS